MAMLAGRSLVWLRAPGNSLAFLARRCLRWSRGVAALPNEDKAPMFEWLCGAALAQALATARRFETQYDLAALRTHSTRLHWAENLQVLESLERLLDEEVLPVGQDGVLRAIDVGCGAFHYATALQRFFALGGRAGGPRREVVLRGIEVDGHGIYRDGHSRADHARAHARLAGDGVLFQVADFTQCRLPEQDVVTLWFPFLTRSALLRWGLPLGLFGPARLLAHAVATVRKGGLLVVANQTAVEFASLRAQLAGAPVTLLRTASLRSDLVPHRGRTERRIGSVWRRDPG